MGTVKDAVSRDTCANALNCPMSSSEHAESPRLSNSLHHVSSMLSWTGPLRCPSEASSVSANRPSSPPLSRTDLGSGVQFSMSGAVARSIPFVLHTVARSVLCGEADTVKKITDSVAILPFPHWHAFTGLSLAWRVRE